MRPAELPPLTTCLTANRVKMAAYAHDPDFIRTFELMRGRWGASGHLRDRLWNSAAMLLRPDAIAGRNCVAVMRALRQHGLVPLFVKAVSLNSAQTSALWHYQANVSTAERLDLLDRLMLSGPSLFVVLRDYRFRILSPATVHLTYLKGPTLATKRKPEHLRSLAGPVLASLISYIHASDDPVDLVREVGILFDECAVHDFMQAIDAEQDRTAQVCALIKELEAKVSDELVLTDIGLPAFSSDSPPCGPLTTRQHWEQLITHAISCKSFISGETYDTAQATVPDDKRLSLPLDRHLIIPALGEP